MLPSSSISVEGTTIDFNDTSLFTENKPTKITFEQIQQERVNGTYLVNENVAFRLGTYQGSERLSKLTSGLACIRVASNTSTSFSVDGQLFVISNPESNVSEGILVNLGASPNETAHNIAVQINAWCNRLYATFILNYVFISRRYYDSTINGRVGLQYALTMPGSFDNPQFPAPLSFRVLTTDNKEYIFEGEEDVEYSVEENPDTSYSEGYIVHFNIVAGDYNASFKSLQDAFCNLKILGLCDNNGNEITIYCTDLVDTIDTISDPSVTLTEIARVTPSDIVEVDGSILTTPRYVNIDGIESKSILAQLATNLIDVYGTDVSNVEFGNNDVAISFQVNEIPAFNNYIGCILYNYEEAIASKPILEDCLYYLYEQLTNIEGVSVNPGNYYTKNGLEVLTDNNDISSSSPGIELYNIGSMAYPSNEDSKMSSKDFVDYVNETYDDIDVIVFQDFDSEQVDSEDDNEQVDSEENSLYRQVDVITFSDIRRRITLNIKFADSYPAIYRSFLKFIRCTALDITVSRSRLNIANIADVEPNLVLFSFEECSGKFTIDTCEFLVSDMASVFSSNSCSNFELINRFSSYLVSSKENNVNVFSFDNDYITLTTFANIIEKQYSDGSCTFYAFNGTYGKITVMEGFSDIYREDSNAGIEVTYFNNASFFLWPESEHGERGISFASNKQILCGLDNNEDVEYDINNLREYSFNPVADSLATLSTLENKPNSLKMDNDYIDIFGRPRKLSKFYGKTVISISKVWDTVPITTEDFFVINEERYYFTPEYISLVDGQVDHVTLAKIIVSMLSYNTDIKAYYTDERATYDPSDVTKTCINICGFNNISFSDNIKTEFSITSNSVKYLGHNGVECVVSNDSNSIGLLEAIAPFKYIVDYGARQMHTDYDAEYYVNTLGDSENSLYRQGTKEDMFYCKDMVELIKCSYPRFGNTKFILDGISNSVQSLVPFDLSEGVCGSDDADVKANSAVLYGDVCITSTFHGIREVPVFIADTEDYLFKLGCRGFASFTFDNIMVATTNSLIECKENRPETSININNCIAKAYNDEYDNEPVYVVDAQDCSLKIFESTIIGQSSEIVNCNGIYKSEANIFGPGSVQYDDTFGTGISGFNQVVNDHNYQITDASDNPLNTEALDFDVSNIENISISDFYLEGVAKNDVINMIANIYELKLTSPTRYLDIGGRYRCKEDVKTSIDCGAIESTEGLIEADTEIFYVSFNDAPVTDHGEATYISWDDFRKKFESLTEIHKNYVVYLSGYGKFPEDYEDPLHSNGELSNALYIDSEVTFFEQSSLHFIAEKDCVFEGESFIDCHSDYANIIVEGLTVRTYGDFIRALGYESKVTLLNCFLITKAFDEDDETVEPYARAILSLDEYDADNNTPVSMLSCSVLFGYSGDKLFDLNDTPTTYLLGCAIQGNNNALGIDFNDINVSDKGNIFCYGIDGASSASNCSVASEAILNVDLCTTEDMISSDSSKLLYEDPAYTGFAIVPADVANTDSDFYKVLVEGMSLTWNRDISGNNRKLSLTPLVVDTSLLGSTSLDTVYKDNALFCSPGCYNSITENVEGVYDGNPNREITCITEIGRTMITKMLGNTLRFKIEGFALCSDGYDYNNPIMSIKSEHDIKREQILVTATVSNFSGVSVRVGNRTLVYGTDFTGSSKKAVIESLVDAINSIKPIENSNMSSSSTFGASIVNATSGTFLLNKIMPAVPGFEDSPSEIDFDSNYFTTEVVTQSTEYNPNDCLKHQVYPKTGIINFKDIEYLPLAISLYYKIDRTQWFGGFGSEVVLARVTECEDDDTLVGYIFPLCVCHHGLITKGRDSFVVGRIIVQL